MKKIQKNSRRFLNTPSSGCLGAVSWSVGVTPHWNKKKHPNEMTFDAEINVNGDAKGHYVERRAGLRPVKILYAEIGKFIQEAEAALDLMEKNNGKSKR